MRVFTDPTRSEARRLIHEQAQRRAVVVYFTKRDGTERRMVCRADGEATSRKPHLLTVWDQEKGGVRTVNLDTVSRIVVSSTERADRPAKSNSILPEDWSDTQRLMREMF